MVILYAQLCFLYLACIGLPCIASGERVPLTPLAWFLDKILQFYIIIYDMISYISINIIIVVVITLESSNNNLQNNQLENTRDLS